MRQELEDAIAMKDVEAIENISYRIDRYLSKPTATATEKGLNSSAALIMNDIYNAGFDDVDVINSGSGNVSGEHLFIEDFETDSSIWGQLSKAGLTATRNSDGYAGLALRTDTEGFL
jgi:hypothetical protein